MMLPNIASLDLTRPSRDGGRDGVGKYRIGTDAASILVDFALEAKYYSVSNSVGVREMSRLISRLRHRQFGVLVTTSYVDAQAYKEIKEDLHPIVVICAADIADILRTGNPPVGGRTEPVAGNHLPQPVSQLPSRCEHLSRDAETVGAQTTRIKLSLCVDAVATNPVPHKRLRSRLPRQNIS